MNCNNCIEVNPLPKCLPPNGNLSLLGITFPNDISSDLFAILVNHSSNLTLMWEIGTDINGEIISTDGVATNGLDVTDAYDLMEHSYEIKFTNSNLEPVIASIDGLTGCCIKFKVLKPLVANGEYLLTTGVCNA